MTSREARLRAIASSCDELGPEDGVNPRLQRRGSSRKKKHEKTPQLCRQVEETLQLVLSDTSDPVLRELVVARVEPGPGDGNLLVLVTAARTSDVTGEEAMEALTRAAGVLRGAVAASIHRKRTPAIGYAFVPPSGRGE